MKVKEFRTKILKIWLCITIPILVVSNLLIPDIPVWRIIVADILMAFILWVLVFVACFVDEGLKE